MRHPDSGDLPPPTARPLGRAAWADHPLAVGAGGAGLGTRHQPHSARSCELALRAVGAARGHPGGAPLAWLWGVRGRALSHPRPPVLWGVQPGPATHWLRVQGVRVWGPVTKPTARALASWLCALWGRLEGTRGGRLLPGCGAGGVGRSPTPGRTSLGACNQGGLPTGCGCGGCGRGDPSPNPQRALLRAGSVRCSGGSTEARGGASCLGVGRPRWGALPPPTARPLGCAAGARYPLAVGAVCGGGVTAVLGTSSRAAVRCVLCTLPGFAAPGGRCGLAPVLVPWLWPAACPSGVPRGPALVRRASSGPVALGAPVGFPVAVVPSPTLGSVAPGFTGWLRGALGGRPRTGLIVPAAGSCRGRGAGRAPRRTLSGPGDGVVPGGSLRLRSWAACAAVVWREWTRSLTRPVSRTVRLSTRDSAGAPGLFCVDADTSPLGSEDGTPGSRACALVRAFSAGSGGPACRARFGALQLSLWPFLLPSLSARPSSGWGRPVCRFSCFLPLLRPPCLRHFVFSGPGCLGPWRLVSPPPPLLVFFFPSLFCAPLVFGVPCFPALGVLGLGVSCPSPSVCGFFFPFFFVFFPFFFPSAPPLPLALGVFWPWMPWALAPCAPRPSLVCFCDCFPCRGVPVVRCCGSVFCALGCVGVCCCGPGASVGASVHLRSVVRCPLPAPPPFVLLPVVLRVPSGAVLAASLSPVLPLVFAGCAPPPPPPPRRLWCPLLCFVVLRVVWRRGLWRVLCCARWCVGCLCRVGFLRRVVRRGFVPSRVVLFLSCFAVLRRYVLCWFRAPGWFRVVSVSVLCLCVAVLVCLRLCYLCAALLPLRRWLVFCVVACCVCVFAAGPGCPMLSPGGSWRLLVSCFGGLLWCFPGCCAAPCRCALCCLALCCCALCCFVLLRLVLPRAVLCTGALSVALGSCALGRRVLSCPPALCVFCCRVLLRGVARRCALCRVRPGVSCCAFSVVFALCGVAVWPALPRCPAAPCCAPWCCAAAWCCGVLSCCLVGFVSCVCVVSLT